MSPEYIPFPDSPRKIKMLDHEVYNYVSPAEMDTYVKALSERNNFRDYDAVLVNLWGGWELFNDLRKLQKYPKWPYMCEYHHGGVETIPVDPVLRRKKVLIVDDSSESGLTIHEILRRVGNESKVVVALTLDGVPGKIFDPRIDSAVIVDNISVAGKGKDAHIPGEKQLFRQYRGVVAIP